MRILFEHLQFANWTDWCPFVAFAISFAVFAAWMWWALSLPRASMDRMAHLPLEESGDESSVSASTTTGVSHGQN